MSYDRPKLNFIAGATCAVGCLLAAAAVANGFRSSASAMLIEATFRQRRSAMLSTSRELKTPSGLNVYVGDLLGANHE